MMVLEEEKHENEFKAHERHVKHEHDREMREELLHAQQEALAAKHNAAQAALGNKHKAKNSDELKKHSEEAIKQVQVTAAAMRDAAHGDGSDRWSKQLEESMLDLEAEKHDFEEKARLRRAEHKLENEVNKELLHASQPVSHPITVEQRVNKFLARNDHIVQAPVYADQKPASELPGLEDGYSNADIVQTGAGLAFFLFIAAVVFIGLSWQKFYNSNEFLERAVIVPGLGKMSMMESERAVIDLFSGMG